MKHLGYRHLSLALFVAFAWGTVAPVSAQGQGYVLIIPREAPRTGWEARTVWDTARECEETRANLMRLSLRSKEYARFDKARCVPDWAYFPLAKPGRSEIHTRYF